jgi:chaperonin GroES
MLESGEFATIAELAEREGIAVSYMTRVLRLTLLAPDIVEAILDGTQGPEVTLARLREPFPMEWAEQRAGVACYPHPRAYLRIGTRHARVINALPPFFIKEFRSMNFLPLHDRVLVRRIEGEEKTKGGLIIPDNAKEKPAEGEVIACGPGARKDSGELIEMAVKAGDRVLFGKWSGTDVTIDGEELMIMKESDILGIIDVKAAAKAA